MHHPIPSRTQPSRALLLLLVSALLVVTFFVPAAPASAQTYSDHDTATYCPAINGDPVINYPITVVTQQDREAFRRYCARRHGQGPGFFSASGSFVRWLASPEGRVWLPFGAILLAAVTLRTWRGVRVLRKEVFDVLFPAFFLAFAEGMGTFIASVVIALFAKNGTEQTMVVAATLLALAPLAIEGALTFRAVRRERAADAARPVLTGMER